MNEIGINEFNDIIKMFCNFNSVICYATNTIMIDFYNKNEEIIYSFHIDPSWRIIFENKIIASSRNYPQPEDYINDDMEKYEKEWFSKTDFMKYENIKDIKILETYDLKIEWKNGSILNNFVNDIEDAAYFLYDHLDNKIYDIYYGKIIVRNWDKKL
jgi:hypothetical protein